MYFMSAAMRRALLLRGPGWGASVCDVASKQLSRTSPTTTTTQWSSTAPAKVSKRFNSSFQASPKPASSSFKSSSQPLTSKLLSYSRSGLSSPWRPAVAQLRPFNSTSHLREAAKDTDRQDLIEKEKARREEEEEDNIDEHGGFARSEKASKAAQVNLSARLQSSKAQANSAGFGEIWRLIKIARPEAKWLALAFAFLIISSSITMSIPFSIGKI